MEAIEKQIEEIDKQIEEINCKMNDPDLCKDSATTIARVTGYYRAVERFCSGKAAEFSERKIFKL